MEEYKIDQKTKFDEKFNEYKRTVLNDFQNTTRALNDGYTMIYQVNLYSKIMLVPACLLSAIFLLYGLEKFDNVIVKYLVSWILPGGSLLYLIWRIHQLKQWEEKIEETATNVDRLRTNFVELKDRLDDITGN